MPCLRLLAALVILTFTEATSNPDAEALNRNLEDEWLLSDPTTTSSQSTTDYRTMPPGTYTETKTDGSVLVIIVTEPAPQVTGTTSSLDTMPTCDIKCDCSRIEDKESEEYVYGLSLGLTYTR
ncbi:hypothetical protein G7Z17_g4652 [Cylindrodendrum hubeiense]|uniref:Uncharacterized protein n=1 Tax=Cylindrodendrum hubeiense TaxID=595255 RepID=A0A9P5LGY4_9HYPO|nr:hypothetical protein G7Z17_g4652 [Cylindrodendrum hubeiense]